MKNLKQVSILGCGWLGLPLAEHLLSRGYRVSGSTTTPEKQDILRQKNIQPFLINLLAENQTAVLTAFLKTDFLVISFPPRLRAGLEKLYLPQIEQLRAALTSAPVTSVIFVSSTSVYRDTNGLVSENDESALDKNSILYQAEELIKSDNITTTILRFGGLVGGTRHPGRFLAGKTGVAQPAAPVNLIHQQDCIDIISKIISKGGLNETFNAVADQHPSREQFYTAAARALQLDPPQFDSSSRPAFKIIDNAKLKAQLPYKFIYPDPLLFFFNRCLTLYFKK